MAQTPSGDRGGGRRSPDGARGQQGGPRRGKGGGTGGSRSGGGGGGGRSGGGARGGPSRGARAPADAPDPAEALRSRLTTVLARLPETQRKVLEYRMGLVDGHPKKLGETATALGISLAEARQIEERAFAHIRDAIPIQHLQKFLGS